MGIEKIDSQKASVVLTVKAILFVGMVNIAVNNVIFVNPVERHLLI